MQPSTPGSATNTRDKILDAATVVFARYGFEKASIHQVAEQARLSEQLVSDNFADKNALFANVCEIFQKRTLAEAKAAAQTGRQTGLSSHLLLAHILLARMGPYQDALRHSSYATELDDAQSRQCSALISEYRQHFRLWLIELVTEERANGRLKIRPSIASAEFADDAFSVTLGIMLSFPTAPRAEFRARVERILDCLLQGVGA